VIPLFIRRLADGERPVIFGDGTQTRDFTFIDNISLNELVHLLNEIFGAQKEPIYEAERMGDIKHSRANTHLSTELLGDYNVAELREGLVETAKWFLEFSGRIKRCGHA
jgi:UDP-N-acetylglucosamine/UDP-N-acetylgalactosamine 4-epimerase